MRRWLTTLIGAVMAFLAVFAASRVAIHKTRAKELHEGDEAELKREIETSTGNAKRKAIKAAAHLEQAAKEKKKLDTLLDKGAGANDEIDHAFDRFKSLSRRGMHTDSGAA